MFHNNINSWIKNNLHLSKQHYKTTEDYQIYKMYIFILYVLLILCMLKHIGKL